MKRLFIGNQCLRNGKIVVKPAGFQQTRRNRPQTSDLLEKNTACQRIVLLLEGLDFTNVQAHKKLNYIKTY